MKTFLGWGLGVLLVVALAILGTLLWEFDGYRAEFNLGAQANPANPPMVFEEEDLVSAEFVSFLQTFVHGYVTSREAATYAFYKVSNDQYNVFAFKVMVADLAFAAMLAILLMLALLNDAIVRFFPNYRLSIFRNRGRTTTRPSLPS